MARDVLVRIDFDRAGERVPESARLSELEAKLAEIVASGGTLISIRTLESLER